MHTIVQELLPYVGGKTLLRLAPSACPGLVAMELAAFTAATSRIPTRKGAMCRTIAAAATLWISKVANLI